MDCFHFLAFINTAMKVDVQVLCRHMFSFFLDMYLGVELLDNMVTPRSTFRGTAKLFSIAAVPFHIFHQKCMKILTSLHPCQHLFLSVFSIIPTVVSVS